MPAEALFTMMQKIIMGLIIIAIAAIILLSVFVSMGVFETFQVPYRTNITAPVISCAGALGIEFNNIVIESGNENVDVMPIAAYQGVAGYNKANVIQLKSGYGIGSPKFTINTQTMPQGRAFVTLSFWKWSDGGCIDKVFTDRTEAVYSSELVGKCANDFLKADTALSQNACT